MISIACPSCGKSGEVPEAYVGKTVRCRRCDTSFTAAPAVARKDKPAAAEPTPSKPPADMPAVLVDE
jgi:uncharacterized paraquat-inducible protein A